MSTYPRQRDDGPLFAPRGGAECPADAALLSGQELKKAGLDKVTASNRAFVQAMRDAAKLFSLRKGYVTASDLREHAERHGLAPTNPNAWGAVLRGPGWVKVGEEPSRTASCHGHSNPRWRWVG